MPYNHPMATTIKMAVSIQKALFDQAKALAKQLHISRNHLIELALESFIKNYPGQPQLDEINQASEDQRQVTQTAAQIGGERMIIHQGGIYWVPLEEPDGSEPGYTHPHVIVQEDVFNRSRIHTVVVCALTSNIKRASLPGNVLLEAGEANLPRQSVVEVSKLSTVDKTQLGDYLGSLTLQRVDQILAGMQFLQSMTEPRE